MGCGSTCVNDATNGLNSQGVCRSAWNGFVTCVGQVGSAGATCNSGGAHTVQGECSGLAPFLILCPSP
jgi:hypothetical protein